VIWVENSSLFCKDWQTKELAKLSFDGREIFPKLDPPPVGSAAQIVGLAEDASGDIYAVDGNHIHVYSPQGKYKKTLSPGIQLTFGIVVADPDHIYVSGHSPFKRNDSSASIFVVGSDGIQRSFSTPFFSGRSGLEEFVLNVPGILALDRSKGLLYQVSPNLYEIRVFDLQGKPVRTISPPAEYANRAPQVIHSPQGGVGIGAGDTLDDIAVLSNGGLAVSGARLDEEQKDGAKTGDSYTRFLDIYDATGKFLRRFSENGLQLEGKHLWGIDHHTGRAFFSKGTDALEAEIR
jgi:hypothetical protein